jgi:hypothetical protein
LSKVRVPSAENLHRVKGRWRDPFNFQEDDGVLRPLRGARDTGRARAPPR